MKKRARKKIEKKISLGYIFALNALSATSKATTTILTDKIGRLRRLLKDNGIDPDQKGEKIILDSGPYSPHITTDKGLKLNVEGSINKWEDLA